MNLFYAVLLAILALALLCTGCNRKEDAPLPTTTLDISGEWLIRINDWRKISATEWNDQDIYPGTFVFEPLEKDSASGSLDYALDGESIQAGLYYRLIGDSLIVEVEDRGRYTALGVTESEIRLEGRWLDQGTGAGDNVLVVEEMVLER